MGSVEPLNSCQIHSNPPLIRLNINIHFYSYPIYFHFIPRKGAKMIVTMLDVKDKNPRHHINSPSSQRQYVMASALVVGRQVSVTRFFLGGKGFCKGVTNRPKVNQTKNPLLKAEKKNRALFELLIKGLSSRYVVIGTTQAVALREGTCPASNVGCWVPEIDRSPGLSPLAEARFFTPMPWKQKRTSAESLRKTSLVWKRFKSGGEKIKVFFGIGVFF